MIKKKERDLSFRGLQERVFVEETTVMIKTIWLRDYMVEKYGSENFQLRKDQKVYRGSRKIGLPQIWDP